MQDREVFWKQALRRQTEQEAEILHLLAQAQKERAVGQVLHEVTGWPGFEARTTKNVVVDLQKQRGWLGAQTSDLRKLYRQEPFWQTAWQERQEVLLQVQQEEIWDGMRQVYHGLCQMAAEPYFAFLHKVLQENIQPEQKGTFWLGAADLQRMPQSFPEEIWEQGKLVLSSQAAPVEGGFLLDYGGHVQNCALHKLMERWRPEQEKQFSQLLFGEGAEK